MSQSLLKSGRFQGR